MDYVRHVQSSAEGLEIYLTDDEVFTVSGEDADYLRGTLDAAHSASIARINLVSFQMHEKFPEIKLKLNGQ